MRFSTPEKKTVVIVYEYFYPGFLAGGPIQSLCNMVVQLQPLFEFKIITSAFDLNSTSPYPSIKLNEWNKIQLPGTKSDTLVWYNDSIQIGPSRLLKIVKEAQGDILYVNGLFTPWSTWPIVFGRRDALRQMKLIASPRGMLQEGALKIKPLKKKIYLLLLKSFYAFRNVRWHATDEQEMQDVQRIFGGQTNVVVASNISKQPQEKKRLKKLPGKLRLVFLSLISPKKNLHVALQALKLINIPISFHIYGPIKDRDYWGHCEVLMNEQIHEITYRGTVSPDEVQQKLSEYDGFILPTKGENFGHAIYEALSVGTPSIISQHTPWGKLQEFGAGITVVSEKPEDWAAAVQEFIKSTEEQHVSMSKAAFAVANNYYHNNDFLTQYRELMG